MCSKAFYRSILFFYRLLLRRLRFAHGSTNYFKPPKATSLDSLSASSGTNTAQTIVFDLEGGLLRSSNTFPYFMLVALEAGSFIRGLFLLLLYPLTCCLSQDTALRVMTMAAFCGVRARGFRLGRAVLPKHFLEDIGFEALEVLIKFDKRVCFTGMPRVMVEGFLKEYLGVEVVVGREMKVVRGFFTGMMVEGQGWKRVVAEVKREIDDQLVHGKLLQRERNGGGGVVGLGGLQVNSAAHHEIFSICKEVYLESEAEKRKWHPLPRSSYPKPLIFHDGRIALRPTPANSLSLFLWLPLSIPLALTRAAIFLLLPRSVYVPLLASLGMVSRQIITNPNQNGDQQSSGDGGGDGSKGQIYVCNHRTLLDPLYISAAIGRHVTATTYSVSRISEILSPIRTIRLTRNKQIDRRKMEDLLTAAGDGGIVVCPEGTTCREPYLLRFSPLFAELDRGVVPVALTSHVSMFYGTTASGKKCLDPFYFVLNPRPCYTVEFLEKVEVAGGNGGNGGRQWESHYEVANYVQRKIGEALGFECTALTRRDKYLMLADNEGIVVD